MFQNSHRLLSAGLLSLVLTACSEETQPKSAENKPFAAQTEALEQSKQLEQSMQQAAEDKRKEIDAQLQ